MLIPHGLKTVTLSASLVSALLAGGCAGTPPRAERYIPPPMGSTWTYAVTNTGSYGSGTGNLTVRMGEATFEGRKVLSYQNPMQHQLQDNNSGLLAITNPAGEVQMRYDPPVAFEWPLEVGKTWHGNYVLTLVAAGGQKVPFSADWKVEAYEDVTVPAGTFKAWRVSYADSVGEKHTIWAVPEKMGVFAKRTQERAATYAQGGTGTRTLELLSVPTLK